MLHKSRTRIVIPTWYDVNHLQPAYEFMAMLMHGHEFVSNPEENPVILSDFLCIRLLKGFCKKLTADS